MLDANFFSLSKLSKLPMNQVTILQDSRERFPWNLESMKIEVLALQTGDYCSIDKRLVIERKGSLDELISCMTLSRERFERELEKMQAFERALVMVEATYDDFVNGRFLRQMSVKSAQATLAAWIEDYGIPIQFFDNSAKAEDFARTLFYMHHRRRLKEMVRMAPYLVKN